MKSLKTRWEELIERPSTQLFGMSIIVIIVTCFLIHFATLVPAAFIAFFGYFGIVGLVALMVLIYLVVGIGAAKFWYHVCNGMLKEGAITKEALIDEQNTASFVLWVATSLLGLLYLGLGMEIVPKEAMGSIGEMGIFLTTCTFFAITLAVEYVFRFKIQKIDQARDCEQ